MYLTILQSKIHRAQVTAADRDYEGSVSIDIDLMKAAKLVHHQHVHVWNINSGTRFETYAIPAPAGSGMIQINGAAAHQVSVGDLVIISSFCHMSPQEAKKHKPWVVLVGSKNKIKKIARVSGDPIPIK